MSLEELAYCTEDSQKLTLLTQILRFSSELSRTRHANDISSIIFHGRRTRTKFSFCLKMYAEEVKEWIAEADQEETRKLELHQESNSTCSSVQRTFSSL